MKINLTLWFIFLSAMVYGQNTILWEINHPATEVKSYLLGTFHQIGNSFVDSIPQIKESLLESDLVFFESIDSRQQLIESMNKRKCTNRIEKILDRKSYESLLKFGTNWNVDICKLTPSEIFGKLNQELPRIKCNTVKPTDKWNHFDRYLKHVATKNNKSLMGLESDSFQLAITNQAFSVSSNKEDKKRIKQILQVLTSNRTDDYNCQLENDYRNFHIDYILDKECEADITNQKRNENWMKILPNYLKSEKCFIAVGLFHLMKECGLVRQLREEGFVLTPMNLKGNRGSVEN